MKTFAIWFLGITFAMRMLAQLYRDVAGRKAAPPLGLQGIVATLIATAINFWLLYAIAS